MTEVASYNSHADPANKPILSGDGPVSASLTLRGTGSVIEDVQELGSCTADMPMEELRRRYWQDGVLWMKGLLNPAKVNQCRALYLEFVNQGTGMLKPGTDSIDGIFSGADWRDFLMPGAVRVAAGLADDGPFVDNTIRSHKASFYLEFKEEVARVLEPFVGELAGFEDPWCLPRSLLRCAVPGSETTPVHYDQIFLRAGPPTSVTAWVPLGDVGVRDGGLIYLDRAHDIGKKYEAEFSERNAALSDEERISAFNKNMSAGGWIDRNAGNFGREWRRAWRVGNYEAGDVLFHTPFTVHAGAMNESPQGRIRVSTDIRFVDRTKPYDKRWETIAYDDKDSNTARKVRLSTA